jgi:TetR/AcrR family transcriptional repressor of nem operon
MPHHGSIRLLAVAQVIGTRFGEKLCTDEITTIIQAPGMRYERDHKAKTRRRIVKTAARQLRGRGLNGPGVATVMKASGLTVGGFYKHFRSKEDLLVEAIEAGFSEFSEKMVEKLKQAPPAERWKQIVRSYLTLEHCEHSDSGCPVAALAPEIARAAPKIRKRIADIMKARRQRMMEFMPGKTAVERERNFTVIFTAMAGAVSVARVFPDATDKQNVLDSVRDHLLGSF